MIVAPKIGEVVEVTIPDDEWIEVLWPSGDVRGVFFEVIHEGKGIMRSALFGSPIPGPQTWAEKFPGCAGMKCVISVESMK